MHQCYLCKHRIPFCPGSSHYECTHPMNSDHPIFHKVYYPCAGWTPSKWALEHEGSAVKSIFYDILVKEQPELEQELLKKYNINI